MVSLCKSHIGVLSGQVLGHVWMSGGYFSPIPAKLETLKQCSHHDLASMNRPTLYGLLNWFKPYLPDFSLRTEPLRLLLAKPHLEWGPEHTQCVRDTVSRILEGVPKLNFDPKDTLRLETHTGPTGMVGILLQKDPQANRFLPIASHCRVWKPKETMSSELALECLCIQETLAKLSHFTAFASDLEVCTNASLPQRAKTLL